MIPPAAQIQAAVTRDRIERVIKRLPGLSDELLDGVEANLFELGELRTRCEGCASLYRPYIERCPTCARRVVAALTARKR
jgi:uncharacterized OB-fold protein